MSQPQVVEWREFFNHYWCMMCSSGQNDHSTVYLQLEKLKEIIAVQLHKSIEMVTGDDVKNFFHDNVFVNNCLQAHSNAIRPFEPIPNTNNHSTPEIQMPQNNSMSTQTIDIECSALGFYLKISGKIRAMCTHKIEAFPTKESYQTILIHGAKALLKSWLDSTNNYAEPLELQKTEDGNFCVVTNNRIRAPQNSRHFKIVISTINDTMCKYIRNTQSCRLIVNPLVPVKLMIESASCKLLDNSEYDNSPVDSEAYAALSLLCNSHPDQACHIPLLYEPLIQLNEELFMNSRKSAPAFAKMKYYSLIYPFTKVNHHAQKRCLLLYGPPGTGKTEFAKELKETTGDEKKFSGAKMGGKHVQEGVQPLLDRSKLLASGVLLGWYGGASEFRSMLQGQTEAKLSLLAELAERNQHLVTLVIIDEIEKLVESRDKATSSNGPPSQTDHVLSMLNGISDIKNLLIVGMTNRYQDIDSAFTSRAFAIPFLRPLRDERLKFLLSNNVPNEYAEVIASIWLNSVPRSLVAFAQELLSAVQLENITNIEQVVELMIDSYTTADDPPTRMAAQAYYPVTNLFVKNQVNNMLRTASLMICVNSFSTRNRALVSHFYVDAKGNKHQFKSEISYTRSIPQYFWEYCVNSHAEFSALIDHHAIESAFQPVPGVTVMNAQTFINSLIVTQMKEARDNVAAGRRALVFIDVDAVVGCSHDWSETTSNSQQMIVNPNAMNDLRRKYDTSKVKQPDGIVAGAWSYLTQINQKNEPATRLQHNFSLEASATNAEADIVKQTALGQKETGKNTSFKITSEETFSLIANLASQFVYDPKSTKGILQVVLSISNPELYSRFMAKLQHQMPYLFHENNLAQGCHIKKCTYSPTLNGCYHYTRNCKIWCYKCKQFFSCQECHDKSQDNHKLQPQEVTEMLCVFCNSIQIPAKQCAVCDKEMAQYFCGLCNLWTGPNCLESATNFRKIIHCVNCQICCYPEGHNCIKPNQSLPVAEQCTPRIKI